MPYGNPVRITQICQQLASPILHGLRALLTGIGLGLIVPAGAVAHAFTTLYCTLFCPCLIQHQLSNYMLVYIAFVGCIVQLISRLFVSLLLLGPRMSHE